MSILPGCLRLFIIAVLAAPLAARTAAAQESRPPLVGTVAPGAVGKPAQQPRQLGGIRTEPIGRRTSEHSKQRGPRSHMRGVVPPRVADAPLPRSGAIVIQDYAPSSSLRWFPSINPPIWRIDSLAPRVDAWRDIVVDDVICSNSGACLDRSIRMRARWSAHCNCYLFADALNRIWRVE